MLPKLLFLPLGSAFLATACAIPQPGLRRATPIEHTVFQSEQLHTERQILEEREIQWLTVFGNLAAQGNRWMTVHLASVLEAPVVEGRALRITGLVQQDNLLVAGYAGPDGQSLGALALIDVTDPESPVLRAELQLPTMAVASLALAGNFLYFAGTSAQPAGTALGRISIQGFEWQDDLKIKALELNAVTALSVLGERIFILDRTQGELVALQGKDWLVTSQVQLPGLSQLGRDKSNLWVQRHTQILQMDTDLQVKSNFAAGGPTEEGALPGVIRLGQEMMMTGLGDEGVRAFCQANQKTLFHVPAVVRSGLEPQRTETRDAALSQGLLVTANADAGVYLYSVMTEDRGGPCKERKLQVEGYLDLGQDFRAETIHWQKDVLSVGDGNGRLNLIFIDRDTLEADDTDFDG